MLNFSIYTFGCKVNQYESQYLKELLRSNSFEYVSDIFSSDIAIINSCTVTATGDAKMKKFIRRVRRNNKNSIIILTGCFSQAFPTDAQQIPEVDIIIGNTNYRELPNLIKQFNADRIMNIKPHTKNECFEPMSINNFSEHTRAFVKIEDGCNNFCSYCIIPYSRGRVRSKNLSDLKNEVKNLSSNGYCEIVLTGINLSRYGSDINSSLFEAIETISDIDNVKRIRLGSLEPELLDSTTLYKLSKIDKLCPQFHLSLQSGCDETLKRMNRHYTTDEYYTIVQNIRNTFVNPAITTDIMVGFAGETEEEFKQSLEFAKKVKFAKSHIFPYSQRRGTTADKFKNQVSSEIKGTRVRQMTEISQISRMEFLNSQVGTTADILVERVCEKIPNSLRNYASDNKTIYEGYSKNYTPIKIISDKNISREIIRLKIKACIDDFCIAEL